MDICHFYPTKRYFRDFIDIIITQPGKIKQFFRVDTLPGAMLLFIYHLYLDYMAVLSHIFIVFKEGERMYEMPTDLQYKDELRKEEIRIENELEMLDKKDYEQLEKKLKRDLERVRKSLQD